MRIGVDIAAALPNGGHLRGIGRYTFQWLEALGDHLPDARFFCYRAEGATLDPGLLPQNPRIEVRSIPFRGRDWGASMERLLAADPDGLDVFVQACPFDPRMTNPRQERSAVPLASILYDLIPLLRPGECLVEAHADLVYRAQTKVVSRYQRLLAISESARRECLELLKVPPERVVAIGCASNDGFHPLRNDDAADAATLSRLGLDSPYFLFVGQPYEKRKNFDALLEAAACLPAAARRVCQLVLASPGDPQYVQPYLDRAERSGVRLTWVKRPDDALLRTLYQRSRALAFPSLAEGFGLPILEAMQCGAPVLAADASSLPEVAGDAALYFDPDAPLTLSARLAELLYADPRTLADLSARGLERARRFRWEEVAARTGEALHSILRLRAAAG